MLPLIDHFLSGDMLDKSTFSSGLQYGTLFMLLRREQGSARLPKQDHDHSAIWQSGIRSRESS